MKITLNKIRRSGFMMGIGSVMNIFPLSSNSNKFINCDPDLKVLSSDWKEIGKDFKIVFDRVQK